MKYLKWIEGRVSYLYNKHGIKRIGGAHYVEEDKELYDYLFSDAPRPKNIKNDTRLLGFRYIGDRTRDMDLTLYLTPVQLDRELKYQMFYESPALFNTGTWF